MDWPATADELKAAGYRGRLWARCSSCGRRILWALTPNDKMMPVEFAPAPDGPGVQMRVVEVEGREAKLAPLFQAHFASCPDADRHRRNGRGRS